MLFSSRIYSMKTKGYLLYYRLTILGVFAIFLLSAFLSSAPDGQSQTEPVDLASPKVSPASLSVAPASPASNPQTDVPASSTAASPASAVALPEEVYVGIFLQNVNDIDIKSSNFMMDFYIWFRWKGEFDPTASFEFVNLVDSWAMTKQDVYPEPETLPDGSKYQVLRIQGKFNRKFDLADFPLDKQELVIELEDSRHQTKDLRYVADVASTGIAPQIRLPGWEIKGARTLVRDFQYETDFGRPITGKRETYSRLRFSLEIARPEGAYLFRLLFPMIIVLLSSFVVFFMAPSFIDARSTIALTALFSMIALHLTVSSDLPQVGYLRLIDKLYNLSYLITFATLLQSVWAARLCERKEEARALRIDRLCLFIFPIVTFLGFIFLLS
jgi:hypothetical protein